MRTQDFQGSLKETTNMIKKVQKNDEDFPIAITGGEGVGKSTLAIWLGLNHGGFTLQNNVVYYSREIQEKIKSMPKGSMLIPDEGMEAFYKRNWMTAERKNFNIMFSMVRQRNLAFLLCIPNFWDLDAYFRNWRIKMWIHVPERGKALVLMPIKNPMSTDPWCQKKNEVIINEAWMEGGRMPEGLIKGIMRTPHFRYYFEFPDLPADVKAEYKKIKQENWEKLQEVLDEKMAVEQWQLNYGCLAQRMIEAHQYTQNTIATLSGNSERGIAYPSDTSVHASIRAAFGVAPSQLKVYRNNGLMGMKRGKYNQNTNLNTNVSNLSSNSSLAREISVMQKEPEKLEKERGETE